MKLLFDFLPIILFFVTFKYAEANKAWAAAFATQHFGGLVLGGVVGESEGPVLLATLMVPAQVTLIPQYILFRELNWVNTFAPLVVPAYFGGPFYVFLLRQFFLTIPKELDEAAIVDGRVFIGSDKGRLHCLEAATGRELWSFETKDAVNAAPSAISTETASTLCPLSAAAFTTRSTPSHRRSTVSAGLAFEA